ncbi:hypothetical protein O162_34880 [Pseudomonas putida SJ3]|nr:hypothetical protein O162_34880 [Pseudomonas putida SJ3]
MSVAQAAVEREEDDAHGVEHPAGGQPGKAGAAQRLQQRFHCHQHDPAHHGINDDRQDPRLGTRLDLLQHTDHRQPPDHAEQAPAPGAAQADQAEWRVTASDQQVDRKVIELAHDYLGPPAGAVVQGGNAVQQQQGAAVDGETDDLPRVPLQARDHDQPDGTDTGQDSTDQVGPGIEAFTVIHANTDLFRWAGFLM